MGYDVKCPQCGEDNPGSRLYCLKCQTNLIGIPREQNTPASKDDSETFDEIISRPLRVLGNRRDMLGGALSCIAAIASTIYFYFKGTPDVSMCAGTLFGLSGIVLLLISWDWVEATNKEITVHKVLHTKTIHWGTIYKIETISHLGIVILLGDEGTITLYPMRWAGQDKELMLRLLEAKITKTGIQAEEVQLFRK
jgi:hypothetical protein